MYGHEPIFALQLTIAYMAPRERWRLRVLDKRFYADTLRWRYPRQKLASETSPKETRLVLPSGLIQLELELRFPALKHWRWVPGAQLAFLGRRDLYANEQLLERRYGEWDEVSALASLPLRVDEDGMVCFRPLDCATFDRLHPLPSQVAVFTLVIRYRPPATLLVPIDSQAPASVCPQIHVNLWGTRDRLVAL